MRGAYHGKTIQINLRLRLTENLHKALRDVAKANYRSLNSEITLRLAESLSLAAPDAMSDTDLGKVVRRMLEENK